MSVYITPAQRAAQKRISAPALTDTCQRLTFASSNGDYGTGTAQPTYTAGASFVCSFQEKPVRDAQEESEVVMGDADLFYAHGVTLLPSDRVTITHLLGEAVATPQTYQIVAGPYIIHNVMHAELRLVTDGSDV